MYVSIVCIMDKIILILTIKKNLATPKVGSRPTDGVVRLVTHSSRNSGLDINHFNF